MELKDHLITGKRILITGGTTGIGRETALQLATLGANVLVVGTDVGPINDTLNDFQSGGNDGILRGLVAGLSTPEGVAQIFEKADILFGNKLDVLINNAALAFGSVLEGSYADWRNVISTNLLAYIACSHQASIRMQKGGHIINIGSMSAHVREKGSSVYVATKAGIEGFTESLRKEVNEKGIKVSLIEPGATDTDMQPDPTDVKYEAVNNTEMMTAGDVAKAVTYILTQDKRCDVVELRVRPHLQLI